MGGCPQNMVHWDESPRPEPDTAKHSVRSAWPLLKTRPRSSCACSHGAPYCSQSLLSSCHKCELAVCSAACCRSAHFGALVDMPLHTHGLSLHTHELTAAADRRVRSAACRSSNRAQLAAELQLMRHAASHAGKVVTAAAAGSTWAHLLWPQPCCSLSSIMCASVTTCELSTHGRGF